MGGFAALHFGLRHPSRALSLCVAGCGYGAELNMREQFRAEADAVVASLRADGMAAFASRYAHSPTREQFEAKDPRGFAVFKQALAGHSALGAANTQLGCQKGASVAVSSARRDGPPHGADADPHRRRGLALPDAGVADEAHIPSAALSICRIAGTRSISKRQTYSTPSSATS
jgi:pimeloyl-ACP methyl ester carboxylesterase